MDFIEEGQDDILREMVATIGKGNALAFVGSGVSKAVDYPLWHEFVNELAKIAHKKPPSINKDSTGGELIEAVEWLKKKMGDSDYYSAIRNIFTPLVRPPFSMMHQQILEMPFVSFPTTNIDNCHMAAISKIRSNAPSLEYDVQPLLQIHKIMNRKVYYIHGKIEADDKIRSVVLSKSEYESAYHDKSGATREFLI